MKRKIISRSKKKKKKLFTRGFQQSENATKASKHTSRQDYIIATAPKATARRPPETRFTTPALVSEAVSAALSAPVLDAASVLEPEAVLEDMSVAELDDVEEAPVVEAPVVEAPVVEAEAEVLVVLVWVLMVEGLVVVDASVVAEVEETLEELVAVDEAPEVLAVVAVLLAVELSVAVAPETLKRGR